MGVAKIAISIDNKLLKKLDSYVSKKHFKTRSQAISAAVSSTIERYEHKRLAEECEKLDKAYEQALSEEGLSEDIKEWPEF